MIRDRRDEDLAPLCAILQTLEHPRASLSASALRDWLTEHDAERSWVFDMAPVRVAPTRNVVGHVQMYRPTGEALTLRLVELSQRPAHELIVIGRLFVRPNTYEHRIGRYLLKESATYVRRLGRLPVLDREGSGLLSRQLCQQLGFEELPAGGPGVAPMIFRA